MSGIAHCLGPWLGGFGRAEHGARCLTHLLLRRMHDEDEDEEHADDDPARRPPQVDRVKIATTERAKRRARAYWIIATRARCHT